MQRYGDEENCGEKKKNEKLLYTIMPNNIRQASLSTGYSYDFIGGQICIKKNALS